MSIKKRFNGKTIRKPGAYSRYKVDNSSGSQSPDLGTVFIVGESSKGAPGSVTGITEFSSERLDTLIELYGSGPLIDCAVAAVRPSKQNGIGGASIIQVWKTNASVQASVNVASSFVAKDKAWGVGGNDLSLVVAAGSSGNQKTLSITKLGDTTEALGENAALPVLTIDYTGNGSAAAIVISGGSRAALALTTSLSGQSDGSANLNITLKNYTMKTLVDYINAQTGYAAVLTNISMSQKAGNELDPLASSSFLTPKSLYRVQQEVLEIVNASSRLEMVEATTPVTGLPANATYALTGGAKGASTNTNFSNGFAASLAEEYNCSLAAISRDASEDIADSVQGFTDAASTYTIAAVLAAQESHLRLRGDTKNRKEAQGFGGIRKSTKAAAFTAISAVGSELMQVCMEDCYALDYAGNLRYMHPHVFAAFAMGIRAGTDIGEPLTFKYPQVLQVGHFINPATGLVAGDFNPGLDLDAAIDAGVLFAEKAKGGYRFVVDCTTYGIDESFVFNRGSVVEAAQFVNKTIRETAESIFIGKKLPPGAGNAASSIKEAVKNKLRELNAPAVNIITSSDDAPEGYVVDTFVVTVTGNTAYVAVEYKPVQGLDFIFFDFTLGDVSQTA